MSWWKFRCQRTAPRHRPSNVSALIEMLEVRRLLHGAMDLSVSFQPLNAPPVEGFLMDTGRPYAGKPAAGVRYTVKAGDTLSGIARRHGTSVVHV